MKLKLLILLAAIFATLAGCGGSGAGIPLSGGAMFVTDSLDSHSHVWITIKSVTFASASGNVTAYSDPVGTTIDLKTLHDVGGERFAYLTAVPAGTYTGVTVTVDKTVTLFDPGNPTGFTRVFAGNNGSTADLSLTFAAPKNLGPGIEFALDFDLANWNDDGTTITGSPFLGDASGNAGIDDPSRHEHEDYDGRVQGLAGTAPTQTFNLIDDDHLVAVMTSASTVIFNSDGSATPALAEGQKVEVRGAFDTAQNALIADSIKIKVGTDANHDLPRVEGAASSIDKTLFTFVVTIDEAHGFQPSATTVNVVTNSSTVFFVHDGASLSQADFFAALADGNSVHVAGSYDAASNTLTATRVRLEDGDGGDDHHSDVEGPSSNALPDPGTLDITAHEWEGMNIASGTVVHVVTNASTQFNDGAMTSAQWFAALAAGQAVEAEGNFDSASSTLTALKIKFHQ